MAIAKSVSILRCVDRVVYVANFCQKAGFNNYAHLLSLVDGLPAANSGIRPNVNDSVLAAAGLRLVS